MKKSWLEPLKKVFAEYQKILQGMLDMMNQHEKRLRTIEENSISSKENFEPLWVRCELCGEYPKITLSDAGEYYDVKCSCGLESNKTYTDWQRTEAGVLGAIQLWDNLNAKLKAAKSKRN